MTEAEAIDVIRSRIGTRSIVLVGLMGCGKSSVGKRLAAKLSQHFVDADDANKLLDRPRRAGFELPAV